MLLLISGASGAGKTSVREAIARDLAADVEAVELRHLGNVPVVPDVAWRHRMAERAVARSRELDEHGRHLLLGVFEPAQLERLRRRGEPEELLPHHVAFAAWLRRHASDPAHMPHVLTSGGWAGMRWSRLTTVPWQITVDEAGRAALQWVRDAISGRAPVFRRCR